MKETIIYHTNSGEQFYDRDEAEINEKIAELRKTQLDLIEQVKDVQETCSHKHMTIKASSSTGGYDRSDDSYWFDANCRACGKSWRVDQDENGIVREKYQSKDPRIISK